MKKLALIGCGGIGEYHLSHFLQFKDIEPAGFCDLVLSKAEAFAKRAGGRAFSNFIEMYDAIDPDMVFICVPPTCHGEIEFETLRRGIPFFVEKPLALDLELACEVNRLVAQKGLITACGFQCRYDDINPVAKDFIAKNPIVHVAASRVGGIPAIPWWKVKATSGGQLAEQTIHQMDMLRYLLCDEPDTVYSVASRGYITRDECPGYFSDDLSATLVTFKSGLTCTMMTGCYSLDGASWDSKMTFGARSARMDYRLINRVTIFGHDNEADKADIGGVVKGDGMQRRTGEETGVTTRSSVDVGVACDRTFIDAVLTGNASAIRSPYDDALKTLKFVLACNESMATGQPVKVSLR